MMKMMKNPVKLKIMVNFPPTIWFNSQLMFITIWNLMKVSLWRYKHFNDLNNSEKLKPGFFQAKWKERDGKREKRSLIVLVRETLSVHLNTPT